MGAAESSEANGQENEESTYPSALVIVGPSGVGKGTLISKLMERSDRFGFSCSHTTRAPREGEKVGISLSRDVWHDAYHMNTSVHVCVSLAMQAPLTTAIIDIRSTRHPAHILESRVFQ